MNSTLKKLVASATVATTLAVGAVGITGATAATTAAKPAATASPARKGQRPFRRMLRRHVVEISAKTIGIPPKDLVAQLKDGKSIAEVATDHGARPDTVVQALESAATKRIDRAVSAAKLTSERAAKLEARLPKAAERVVDAHRHAH